MRKKDVRFTCFAFLFLQKMTELMFIYKNNATDLLYFTVIIFVVAFKIPYFTSSSFLLFCVFNVIRVAHNLVASDIFIFLFSFIKHE